MHPVQHPLAADGSAQDAHLRAEVLQLLQRGLRSAVPANVLLAVLLVGVQWPVIGALPAGIWLAVMAGVLAGRVYLLRRSAQPGACAEADVRRELAWFRSGAIATGAVWGLAALLLFPGDRLEHQVFLAFVLAGVSAGAISSLTFDRLASHGFVAAALIPLALRFAAEGGSMPLAMGLMTLLFLVFVALSATRMRQHLLDNARLRTEAVAQETALRHQQQLSEVIARAQAEFIREPDRRKAFDSLLTDMLALTESEYGFIGEVLHTPTGEPYLKTYAITDIAWDDATRAFYAEHAPKGMEFTNLKTLFGAALVSGEAVIANDPGSDPRRGGLPQGHPALNAFLGVPVYHGDEMVAMLGVANRPRGYDPALIEFLQPMLATLGQLVVAARLRKQLSTSERRLRSIIDGTRIGTWEWNVQTGETVFNERWAEIVGYTLDELAPVSIATWQRLAHPEDLQRSGQLLERHFAGAADFYEAECRMRHKDGHWVWVHDRGRVVSWTGDGKPLLMSGTHADISERKRMERMKNEFVSTVSHELRTPLTSISGALGLLSGGALGELPAPAREMIAIAQKNSQRLTYLINDLLDMEKLAAGKLHFDLQPQSLMPLLMQALNDNQAYGVARRVTLQCAGGSVDVTVRVDGLRLLQVLSNLLSNAIKFSPEGGRVELGVRVQAGAVRVTVTDHGPGIPVEFRRRIFQKFAQADASDARQKGGTGLGLAISKQLIEGMGGQIGFESTEGRGASFHFELPVWETRSDVSSAGGAAHG